MPRSRLNAALDTGLVALPDDGPVQVIEPAAGLDLSAIPDERLRIVTRRQPGFDDWAARGVQVVEEAGEAPLTILSCPRSRDQARAMVAEASALSSRVVVDGAKTDGIDGLWREVRRFAGEVGHLTMAHGRLFAFDGGLDLPDWRDPGPVERNGWWTRLGVFSADGPDRGSAMLAEALPPKLPARMADLGAGWGYLSRAVLAREGVAALDLVEAEGRALDCARLNVTDPRASFHWADVTRFDPDGRYDGIVMNPPFHTGRAAEPGLGQAFIAAAGRLLTPSGQLWLVANRHLPYESILRDTFRTIEDLGGDAAFKLTRAARPLGRR